MTKNSWTIFEWNIKNWIININTMSTKKIVLQKNNGHEIYKNILWSFYNELLFYLLFEL